MAHYIISYDLHRERNYEILWSALGEAGARKLLESLWLLESSHTAGSLLQALIRLVDNDDSLVVVELKPGSDWATIRALPGGTDWLINKIKRY